MSQNFKIVLIVIDLSLQWYIVCYTHLYEQSYAANFMLIDLLWETHDHKTRAQLFENSKAMLDVTKYV